VVVRNLDIVGITVNEPEADSPLVVDRDCVLALPVSPQPMQPVPWWDLKVIKA